MKPCLHNGADAHSWVFLLLQLWASRLKLSTAVFTDNPPIHCSIHWQPKCPLQHWLKTESFLRNYHVLSQSRNSPHFMEPESSSPRPQVPTTCPYPPCLPSSHLYFIYYFLPFPPRLFQVVSFLQVSPPKPSTLFMTTKQMTTYAANCGLQAH